MDNYNCSQYYRANPYKDIGYMPPMAQKNRKSPGHTGEIPQGEHHFDPSNKKHYNLSYRGEIEEENILREARQRSPIEQEVMQKSYFRSLNSKDIEGSSTNTLISKAVKNKLKAQEEIHRRRQEQKAYAQQQSNYQLQQEAERRKYNEEFHRRAMANRIERPQQGNPNSLHSVSPNTNNKQQEEEQRRKRQNQLLWLAQQRKNYALVNYPSLQPTNKQISNSVVDLTHHNYHIKSLQGRHQTQEVQQGAQTSTYGRQQHKSLHDNYRANENKVQGENQQDLADKVPRKLYQQDGNSQDFPSVSTKNRQYPQVHSLQPLQPQRESYPQKHPHQPHRSQPYPDTSLQTLQNNYQPNYQNIQNLQQSPGQQQGYRQGRSGAGYGRNQALQVNMRNKQQLRKYNPTFLSYGSPTFAIASRNVIGS